MNTPVTETHASDAAQAQALHRLLQAVIGVDERVQISGVEVIEDGSARCQIVRVQGPGAPAPAYFLKWAVHRPSPNSGEQWRGIGYEAHVYRDVLSRLTVGLPRFFGSGVIDGCDVLVTEALVGHRTLDLLPAGDDRTALGDAAAWLACFHGATERLEVPPGVRRQSTRDYETVIKRTVDGFADRAPWLVSVSRRAVEAIPRFLAAASVLAHGEFYPGNILYRDGDVRPVDWESAVVGPGETDLAQLVDGWVREHADHAASRYAQTRWPDGLPDDFGWRLTVAKMLVHYRWLALGDLPVDWHLKVVHEAAVSLGWAEEPGAHLRP